MLCEGERRKEGEERRGKQIPGYQSSFFILRNLRGVLNWDERDQKQKHFPL